MFIYRRMRNDTMGYSNLKFSENSTFLVTGGAGFIGSNLCEAILKMGYKVRCLDDLSTGKQANVDIFLDNPNYTFVKGDIKDLDTCMAACEGVDYVLNQAAWGSVPRSIEMPLFYEKNNKDAKRGRASRRTRPTRRRIEAATGRPRRKRSGRRPQYAAR